MLDNRRIDRKIRIRNGELEQMYNLYHKGELFREGEWHTTPNTTLKDGEQIVRHGGGVAPHGSGEMTLDKWIESTLPAHTMEDMLELWESWKEDNE